MWWDRWWNIAVYQNDIDFVSVWISRNKIFAVFRIARFTLQTRKLWLVGVVTDRNARFFDLSQCKESWKKKQKKTNKESPSKKNKKKENEKETSVKKKKQDVTRVCHYTSLCQSLRQIRKSHVWSVIPTITNFVSQVRCDVSMHLQMFETFTASVQ